MWIYRPIMAGKCTIEGVLSGLVGIDELLELNAMLDLTDAYQGYANEQYSKKK
jgi:hypothetical protein